MRVAVPTLGLLALVSACASGGSAGSSVVPSPAAPPPMTPMQIAAQVDSSIAQQVANQIGPGASIRADYANVSGMRRVVASFHLDADAYVMVGHIDADGVLRIVFPVDPKDDGFVRGNRDYRTPEFFAGFADEYRFRARQQYSSYSPRTLDSYDGQLGYAFIIASWRPLKVSEFQTNGAWDTFELADDKYLNDPRPAIYELASLLVGQNREAYTVEFARYSSSSALYAGYGSNGFGRYGYGAYGFGSGYCAGYEGLGYGLSFGSQSMFMPVYDNSLYPVGFYSRGQYLLYDQLGDCYRTAYPPGQYPGFYNGYGYRIASGPTTPTTPVPLRGFTPRDRAPVASDLGAHVLPATRLGATDRDGEIPQASTSYRQRGLITAEDPGTLPGRRTPTIDARSEVENHARPSIQEMVGRAPQNPVNNNAWMRAQSTGGRTNAPSTYTAPTTRRAEPSNGESRGVQQQPQPETRYVAPVNREPAPRPSPPETRTTKAPPPPTPAPAPSPPASSSTPPASTGSRPPTP